MTRSKIEDVNMARCKTKRNSANRIGNFHRWRPLKNYVKDGIGRLTLAPNGALVFEHLCTYVYVLVRNCTVRCIAEVGTTKGKKRRAERERSEAR